MNHTVEYKKTVLAFQMTTRSLIDTNKWPCWFIQMVDAGKIESRQRLHSNSMYRKYPEPRYYIVDEGYEQELSIGDWIIYDFDGYWAVDPLTFERDYVVVPDNHNPKSGLEYDLQKAKECIKRQPASTRRSLSGKFRMIV